ncbi:MAG: hypothetical protein ACU0BG_09770 [Paracoccus sp. (in: a-proteobacteria)]|uniref:hypothetical protein n=1 Tax=unclassified Paracoccus (in: a-proteobacteria) TaxID=2688777 RepID=UPI000C58F54C|nr:MULTISPECIES: hypothetical protein [unclassified Paracoccus (in: a-proteobacteria)]MAN55257.1 hypothetical protein [Paracoccus sp. (in: a-proteobacteria)]MDB2552782.1 hypothetical protein [Paracoccus sp. (in: a-proteobacteria)]HIC67128.1 hypothetical protein [Paracoccus sp. (in: a-proteobacteria)]
MPRVPSFGISADRKPVFAPDDILASDRWSDFDKEAIVLEAIVIDNNISGSDATLQVRAHDGMNWTIELGRRARNMAAGLTPAQALPGDPVSVRGRRLHRFGENRIKAMHLTIAGRDFDLYPASLEAS